MSISNTDDTIDSRDILKRIQELENMRDDAIEAKEDDETVCTQEDHDEAEWGPGLDECDRCGKPQDLSEANQEDTDDLSEWGFDKDDAEELRVLKEIEDECGDEFHYGITLIHEDYFTEYCQELVQSIGDLPRNIPSYIENNIDWDGVADDLRVDYSSVDYDGNTYWYW